MKRLRATFIVSPKLKNCCIYKHFKNNASSQNTYEDIVNALHQIRGFTRWKNLLLIFKLEQTNELIVIINLKKDYLLINIISNQYLLTEKWRADHKDLKLFALFPCFLDILNSSVVGGYINTINTTFPFWFLIKSNQLFQNIYLLVNIEKRLVTIKWTEKC